MFLRKILLMCILIHGSRSGPTFFKFFRPIKIEDSEIPASSVAYPETNQKTAELLETEEESSLFLKPNIIDSSNKEVPLPETGSSSFLKPIRIGSSKKQVPLQAATEPSSFLKPIRIGTSKKQGSFQVPVINKLLQEKIKGGPGLQTERPTSLLKETDPFLLRESDSSSPHQESDSSSIPHFPQDPLRTSTEFSSFFKPIRIDSSKKQVSLQTASEPSSLPTPIRIGNSKKQGSFQVPVINRLVQEKIFGGPKLQTERPTSPPQESVPFLPRETDSSIPPLPQVPLRTETEFSSFFKPIKIGSSRQQSTSHTQTDAAPGSLVKPISIPIVSSEKRVSETNSFLAQKSSTSPQESNQFLPLGASSFVPQKLPFLVKSTTTPAPETSKAIVQGFRVIGDPSNAVVFLDLQALKASGIDVSSSTIHIGSNSLEIIDGLQTEAPTNEKLTLPVSAPSNKKIAIPAPSFVTKATKQSLPSSESLKPSRLPESIKKFSMSLKSDKAPVFFSRKVSTSPSLSVQDFSNFPVESVSSPSLETPGFSNFPAESVSSSSFSGTRGFSNFPVESASSSSLGTSSLVSQDFSNFPVKSVFQAVPKAPLRHASSIVDDDSLSGGLSLGGQPVALDDASLAQAHVSHLLVDDDPLVQLENLKKIKVPGSFITSSVSPSEGSQPSVSSGQESSQGANNLLSLQENHHQQHQLQHVHQQESLLWDHDEHSSQQHHPEHQLQQVEEQQQDYLHEEYREISPVEETASNAQQYIPLQQHRQHLQQHQQQLQHVRQQEQQSLLREHVELASEEESPRGIHRVLPSQQQQQLLQQDFQEQQDSAHGEHPFSSGPETRNEAHDLLPLQQQEQHQQQLHLHQQQLQEHQQQVEELKQQLLQLEQHRQHQLHQLKQQQESIHRFSLPQKEEDSRKSTYQQDLENAFQFLG